MTRGGRIDGDPRSSARWFSEMRGFACLRLRVLGDAVASLVPFRVKAAGGPMYINVKGLPTERRERPLSRAVSRNIGYVSWEAR